jgi:hypothetical protein
MLKYNINLHVFKRFPKQVQISQNNGFLLGLSIVAEGNIEFLSILRICQIQHVSCAGYNLASEPVHETQWL